MRKRKGQRHQNIGPGQDVIFGLAKPKPPVEEAGPPPKLERTSAKKKQAWSGSATRTRAEALDEWGDPKPVSLRKRLEASRRF